MDECSNGHTSDCSQQIVGVQLQEEGEGEGLRPSCCGKRLEPFSHIQGLQKVELPLPVLAELQVLPSSADEAYGENRKKVQVGSD